MIEVSDLCCAYGSREVLSNVSFILDPGEMVGLLGPNGSGKTTLLLALSGVLPLTDGAVAVNGHDIRTLRPKQRAGNLAVVPQRFETTFDLTVRALVLMGRYPYIRPLLGYGRNDRSAAAKAMRDTATTAFSERMTGELSGGELQRALIARALCQDTDIMLLDEAASGLDAAAKIAVHDLLRVHNARGVTVLSAIHDLNLAALYCERLLFLKKGRLILDGPTTEVFTEKNLTQIYETPIKIYPHPVTGAPQSHLVPGSHAPLYAPRDC